MYLPSFTYTTIRLFSTVHALAPHLRLYYEHTLWANIAKDIWVQQIEDFARLCLKPFCYYSAFLCLMKKLRLKESWYENPWVVSWLVIWATIKIFLKTKFMKSADFQKLDESHILRWKLVLPTSQYCDWHW